MQGKLIIVMHEIHTMQAYFSADFTWRQFGGVSHIWLAEFFWRIFGGRKFGGEYGWPKFFRRIFGGRKFGSEYV